MSSVLLLRQVSVIIGACDQTAALVRAIVAMDVTDRACVVANTGNRAGAVASPMRLPGAAIRMKRQTVFVVCSLSLRRRSAAKSGRSAADSRWSAVDSSWQLVTGS